MNSLFFCSLKKTKIMNHKSTRKLVFFLSDSLKEKKVARQLWRLQILFCLFFFSTQGGDEFNELSAHTAYHCIFHSSEQFQPSSLT